MKSRRQEKIESTLKETIGTILLRGQGVLYEAGVMVSITQVNIVPDMSIARVYLSIFNAENPTLTIQGINQHGSVVRRDIGRIHKNTMRKIPQVEFYIDDSLDQMEKVQKLIKVLNRKEDTKGEK